MEIKGKVHCFFEQSGFEEIRPKIREMTNLMMDCYQQGFKDCWKILTGKNF